MNTRIASFFVALCCVTLSSACTNPKVQVRSSFTTQDATIVSQIAFIAEFSLTCSNQLDNLPLYAEISNRLSPVVKVGDKYQVSWSEETKKAKNGNHEVKLYDEEGYSNLKKAQRSGENTQNVKPLASLNVKHNGSTEYIFLNSEIVVSVGVAFVAYIAVISKAKLTS